ncbi:hypothetical protein TNIN_174441 [Trichonephila inaurata madagascariensis]|uniref:Uncharacterized protein n=1 Tax=Trichonephila inaurata madagascariensis TaxID=2747483 RepID=A0A8X6YPN9_9ARAC|nr:hypothetical protein TNIN_174441 [Trichonephila inaurata madagascariensis]
MIQRVRRVKKTWMRRLAYCTQTDMRYGSVKWINAKTKEGAQKLHEKRQKVLKDSAKHCSKITDMYPEF